MKKGSWIAVALVALVLVAVVVLAVKLISGVFALASGALDTILGLALIAGLVVLVIWMFTYAAKKRK